MTRRDSFDDELYPWKDGSGTESEPDFELPSPSTEHIPSPPKQPGESKPQLDSQVKLGEESELQRRLTESLISPAESDTSQGEDDIAIDDRDGHRRVKYGAPQLRSYWKGSH